MEFLHLAYAIGALMTCIAIGLRRIADAIALVEQRPILQTYFDDQIRTFLWPFYLARPW